MSAAEKYVGLSGETLTAKEWEELLPLIQEAVLKGLRTGLRLSPSRVR